VDIVLAVGGYVEVDDHIHVGYIEASGSNIGSD
jgi:hypothetical protein